MKVEENRRPSIADASAVELLQLQEAAKIANIYHKGDPLFTRNTNLSHIVHGTFNFGQFVRNFFSIFFNFSILITVN